MDQTKKEKTKDNQLKKYKIICGDCDEVSVVIVNGTQKPSFCSLCGSILSISHD
jgi:ribosomal protein S27E